MTGIVLNREIWTHTYREHHVKMKTEIRVMLLQAKEHQRLPAKHWNLDKRHGTDFSSQPQKEPNLLTP